MKYKTLRAFLAAHKSGQFTGYVCVDNDSVIACQPTEDGDPVEVFDFGGDGPEGALIDLLGTLGIEAERP